jgi:hypothetical protein
LTAFRFLATISEPYLGQNTVNQAHELEVIIRPNLKQQSGEAESEVKVKKEAA